MTSSASEPTAVDLAVADLAARLSVDAGTVATVADEQVTWRDGSLGCPQPDMSYTQALVNGYRIQLAVDGVTYWYHGANGAPPFACDNPQPPAPPGSGSDR